MHHVLENRLVVLSVAAALVAGCARPAAPTAQRVKRAEYAAEVCAAIEPRRTGDGARACEGAVAEALPETIDEGQRDVALKTLRAASRSAPPCAETTIVQKSVPLDLPKPAASAEVVGTLVVTLAADGTTLVNGKPAPDDQAVLAAARAARESNPDVRAVINADAAVPHGRVIRALDILKQAQVARIAFGVRPMAPAAP